MKARLGAFLPWLRMVLGISILGLGTLAPWPCPQDPLWYLSLAAAEWGHWLVLPCLLLLAPGALGSTPARLGLAAGFLGVFAGLMPLTAAAGIAPRLQTSLRGRFPGPAPRRQALSLAELYLPCPPAGRIRTLVYDARKGLKLDLWSRAQAPAPTVVVVHGGSWRRGSRSDFSDLNGYLCSLGYTVASVDYSLAPQHRFPEPLEDVRAALRYLAQRPEVDPTRLALLGRSAGAHLALLEAFRNPSVRGVISYYGPVDMKWSWNHPSNPEVLDSTGAIRDLLGGTPQAIPQVYEAASPLAQAHPGAPSTLLIHGAKDDMVYAVQSRMLEARLASLGVPCLRLELPWANHGCDVNLHGPSGQLATYAVESFLASVMGGPSR